MVNEQFSVTQLSPAFQPLAQAFDLKGVVFKLYFHLSLFLSIFPNYCQGFHKFKIFVFLYTKFGVKS